MFRKKPRELEYQQVCLNPVKISRIEVKLGILGRSLTRLNWLDKPRGKLRRVFSQRNKIRNKINDLLDLLDLNELCVPELEKNEVDPADHELTRELKSFSAAITMLLKHKDLPKLKENPDSLSGIRNQISALLYEPDHVDSAHASPD